MPSVTLPPTITGQYIKTFPYLPRTSSIDNNCIPLDIPIGGPEVTSSDVVEKINVEYNIDTFGDIGALSNSELLKFVREDLTGSANAKPTFIYNSFILSSGSVSSKPYLTIYNNISYTQPTNLKPWYDSYEEYFQDIRHLSQDRSVIPEFIVSNFDNIANGTVQIRPDCEPVYYPNNAYKTLYGRDYFLNRSIQLIGQDLSDFDDLPFEPFIDSKSNKIKIVLNGIKKLLPYNGFYPSEYSKNIVNAFADTFFYNQTEIEKQALMQPFFGPGVFFNTIKAGIPCGYPVYITSSVVDFSNVNNIYSGGRIKKSYTDKVDFEDLLAPEAKYNADESYIVYADPARSIDFFKNSKNFIFPSASVDLNIDKRVTYLQKYKKILNNFLSETTSLFLENGELTTFSSAPETSFTAPEAGKQYGMQIEIGVGNNFSLLSPTKDAPESVASVFGPKFIVADELFHAPAYLQNTGSTALNKYLYGNTLVLYYYATSSAPITAQDIFNNLYVATGSSGGEFGGILLSEYGEHAEKIIPRNSVLDAIDINIVERFLIKEPGNLITFSSITTGRAQPPIPVSVKYLQIKTKFETPLVNFIDKGIEALPSSSIDIRMSSSVDGFAQGSLNLVNYSFDGIWNRYGSLPEDGQSLQIGLNDSLFKKYSLLSLLGFKREQKNIGVIANTKIIKEAIAIVPYKKQSGPQSLSGPIANAKDENFIESNKKVLLIDQEKINKALGVPNYKILKISEIKSLLGSYAGQETYLIKMLKAMVDYNIPPHLNWLWDTNIDPFVIYFGEFTHQLNRQELADIWQGTIPQIAEFAQEQQIVIEHDLGQEEILSLADLKNSQTYFMVFKVKQRGHYDYDAVRKGETEALSKTNWYSYNWPYDYFSLVELLNIKAGEVYTSGSA